MYATIWYFELVHIYIRRSSVIKVYLWFIILLFTVSALARFFFFIKDRKTTIPELFEAMGGLVSSLGLYGYIYQSYYFNQMFWIVVIIMAIIAGIYSHFFSSRTKETVKKIGMKKAIVIYGITNLLTAPHLYFIYKYSMSGKF